MKKLLGIVAVVLGLVLSGCGGANDVKDSSGDSTASYCDALKGAKANLSAMDFTKLDENTYQTLQTELSKVSSVAPSDVKDDWLVVTGALDDLHSLLADAGISFDDLQNLSAGQLPAGVDAQTLQELAPKLQQITSDGKLETASKAIEASAKKDCGINLNN